MFFVWGIVVDVLIFFMVMFVFIIVIVGFIGNILLGGFNFSWEVVVLKVSKMLFVKGIKCMFGF